MEFYSLLIFVSGLLLNVSMSSGKWVPHETSRVRRQAVADNSGVWPGGRITYTFSHLLVKDTRARSAITSAIDHWENSTCLRFTYRPPHELSLTDKYIVFRGGSRCASSVGMSRGIGPQVIDVSRSCAYTAMIVHELGHAIGLWHEHSRRDRDAHVLVMWKNMKDGSKHNFDIRQDAKLLTPYDLYSVMHYEPKMFSKNNRPTLRTLDPRLQNLIGWHSSLSHYDVMSVSLLYQCAADCPSIFECENDGFMTSSCTCQCPRGLLGHKCHRVDTDEMCGGVLEVQDGTVIRYGNSPLHTSKHCTWLLKGPERSLITLRFNSTNLSKDEYGECSDEIELRYHSIGVPEGYFICKNKKARVVTEVNENFKSVDNKLMLHFESDGLNLRAGFMATVSVRPQKECASSPCLNGGKCEDVPTIGTYVCSCPNKWLGKDCEIPIVDGAWSAWSAWSACAARCGQSTRRRTCTNPRPVNGGKSCSGPSIQTKRCEARECYDLFSCDFGSQRYPDRCGLVPGDEETYPLEWTVTSGKTPSPKTGPDAGHTTGSRSDMYMYLEASQGRKYQQAVLWYKVREPSGRYCLEFFYSLYGSHIGTLSVVGTHTSTEEPETLWQRSGNQGKGWTVARVSLNLRPGYKLGFVATRGATYQGDMALDDISLSPGSCGSWKGTSIYGKGCTYKDKKVKPGSFVYSQKCEEKTCFCNQDGTPDCPAGPIKDICAKSDSYDYGSYNDVGFYNYG